MLCFLCLHSVHCFACVCTALPLSPSHAAGWHHCMKDVLDRTDNTFLITEAISSNHNASGPAGELVCGLAVGSTCKPSLHRNTVCHVKISNLCKRVLLNIWFKKRFLLTAPKNRSAIISANFNISTWKMGLVIKKCTWWSIYRISSTNEQHKLRCTWPL